MKAAASLLTKRLIVLDKYIVLDKQLYENVKILLKIKKCIDLNTNIHAPKVQAIKNIKTKEENKRYFILLIKTFKFFTFSLQP